MATSRRVFPLRLSDEVFDKIGILASKERRSMTNYIELVLLRHLAEVEQQAQENADDVGQVLHKDAEVQQNGGEAKCDHQQDYGNGNQVE